MLVIESERGLHFQFIFVFKSDRVCNVQLSFNTRHFVEGKTRLVVIDESLLRDGLDWGARALSNGSHSIKLCSLLSQSEGSTFNSSLF